MLRRLRNAAITLVATLAAYQLYTVTVGPLLDPPAPVAADEGDDEWGVHVQNSVRRYQQLLANYFPDDHWSLSGSPKVLEHAEANALLVYGDLNRDRFGRVDVTNTALLYFPTPRRGPDDAPRDAIVIDAPGVAKLQFDEAFNPASGAFGWPERGLFEGELTIRSDMSKPGPEDDLFVRTRDLRLEGPLIASESVVTARLGRSEASGRVLEIQLLEDPYAAPGEAAATLGLAGLASIEVREDIRARVVVDNAQQRPGVIAASHAPSSPASVYSDRAIRLASAQQEVAQPPVEVRCDGSFRFDFTTFIASLQDGVTLTRPHPQGPADTLVCDELEARFAREDGASASIHLRDEPDVAQTQGRTLAGLRIDRVDAIGSPAKLESPSVLGAAEGRRLQLWIGRPRVRVEGEPGGRLAMVAYGLNEARAAWIDYESPPEGSGRVVGALSMAGPGWMRVATKPGDPTRLVEARWKATPGGDGSPNEAVRIVRDAAGNPVLHAVGEPEIAAAGVGWLKAARLSAVLLETNADGKAGPVVESPTGDRSRGFLVRTVEAEGGVDFRGAELEGRVDRLQANFTPVEGGSRLRSAGLSQGRDEADSAKDRFRVTGRELALEVALRGRRAEPTDAVCRGGVELRQVGQTDADGLFVTGEALRVRGLAEKSVLLTVLGSENPTDESDAAERAEVRAKGVRLWAEALHVDQDAGRAWVDGPGDARLAMRQTQQTNSMFGALGPETTLHWREGVELLGDQLTARGEVRAEGQDQWIHCAELSATFDQPIDFRGGLSGDLNVVRVDCRGGVSIDHRTRDAEGQTSHQAFQLRTLGADLRTGDLVGQGPGWVRSVHFGGAAAAITTGAGAAGVAANDSGGLRLLRVDFRQGLSGNLNTRVVRFHQRVRALYTPVAAWDEQPPPISPSGPAPGAVTLACNELRVSEDPAGRFGGPSRQRSRRDRLGPLEMYASGSVRIEGRPEGSAATTAQAFAAEAVSGSYSQAKEVFVLEGDANRSATIWRQSAPGRQPERVDGRKLLYWPKLDKFKYEDVRGGVIFGAGAQPSAAPTRR